MIRQISLVAVLVSAIIPRLVVADCETYLESSPLVCDYIAGDVNEDGDVNVGDVIRTLRAAVNLEALSHEMTVRADLTPNEIIEGTASFKHVLGDGVLTVGDVIAVLRSSVGLEPYYFVGQNFPQEFSLIDTGAIDLIEMEIKITYDLDPGMAPVDIRGVQTFNYSHPLSGDPQETTLEITGDETVVIDMNTAQRIIHVLFGEQVTLRPNDPERPSGLVLSIPFEAPVALRSAEVDLSVEMWHEVAGKFGYDGASRGFFDLESLADPPMVDQVFAIRATEAFDDFSFAIRTNWPEWTNVRHVLWRTGPYCLNSGMWSRLEDGDNQELCENIKSISHDNPEFRPGWVGENRFTSIESSRDESYQPGDVVWWIRFKAPTTIPPQEIEFYATRVDPATPWAETDTTGQIELVSVSEAPYN